MKKGILMLKMVKTTLTINPKKSIFKYEREGRFCLGVANIESNNGTITGKRCPFFDYSGGKIVTIDAYKEKKKK